MFKFTTSWDDGDVLDKKLAVLLEKYGMKGTFYVTKSYRPQRLSEEEIKTLSQKHEIGAHTLTHPNLTNLPREEKKKEIDGSKQWLESVLGKEVSMFCYPSGRFDAESMAVVKESGFLGARTTVVGTVVADDTYRVGVSVQVYPFPLRWGAGPRHLLQPLFERAPALRKLGIGVGSMYSWQAAARAAFDAARERGGVFHLWGHSWEIEKYDMWNELEKLFAYCESKGGYTPVANSQALS